MNKMKDIRIEKVTLNIGVGGPGDKMDKALKLLGRIADAKAVSTITNKRIPTWGVRPKLEVGAKLTVRRKKAENLLRRLLQAVENKLPADKFDKFGNFSFGIPEYIDITGVPYDASIGVIGLEVAVTLERPGYRIKRRDIARRKVPAKCRITREEATKFIQSNFDVEVGEEV